MDVRIDLGGDIGEVSGFPGFDHTIDRGSLTHVNIDGEIDAFDAVWKAVFASACNFVRREKADDGFYIEVFEFFDVIVADCGKLSGAIDESGFDGFAIRSLVASDIAEVGFAIERDVSFDGCFCGWCFRAC